MQERLQLRIVFGGEAEVSHKYVRRNQRACLVNIRHRQVGQLRHFKLRELKTFAVAHITVEVRLRGVLNQQTGSVGPTYARTSRIVDWSLNRLNSSTYSLVFCVTLR